MFFHSACLIALAGIGTLFGRYNSNIYLIAGLLLVTITSLFAIEYLYHFDFFIDEFFLKDTSNNVNPGRPAPNTLFCLFLTGIVLLFIKNKHEVVSVIKLTLTLMILSISLIAIIGYIFNMPAGYTWGNWKSMGLNTAICTSFLAVSILLDTAKIDTNKERDVYALGIFILGTVISFLMWQTMTSNEFAKLQQIVGSNNGYTKSLYEDTLDGYFKALERFAARYELSQSITPPLLFDAKNYVKDYTSLQAIFLNPNNGNNPTILAQKSGYAKNVLTCRPKNNDLTSSFAIDLNENICFTHKLNAHDSYLGAIIDLNQFFAALNAVNISKGYSVQVLDSHSNSIYLHDIDNGRYNSDLKNSLQISYRGVTFTSIIWPSQAKLNSLMNPLLSLIFLCGTLVSMLLAMVVWLWQKNSIDLFERKRYENKLVNTNQKLKVIMDNSPVTIIATDKDGVIKYFNRYAEKILGYKHEEVVNHVTPEIIHDPKEVKERALELSKSLGRTIQPGFETFIAKLSIKDIDQHEWTYISKAGKRIPVILSVTAVRNMDNEIIGYQGIAVDISDKKELVKLKNEFVSVVTHELRTPITSIYGALSLVLSQKISADKSHGMLEIAHRNCERLLRLINDILDVQKTSAGRMTYHFDNIDITKILTEAVHDNISYANKFNVKLDYARPNLPILVKADAGRLLQVVTNLISNAVKFSPTNDTVKLDVIVDKHNVRVNITDHGEGIAEDFQDKIFSKFSQDQSTAQKSHGTGLGLNISKSIIEAHHGKIGFLTGPDTGTTFYFELPVITQVEETPVQVEAMTE